MVPVLTQGGCMRNLSVAVLLSIAAQAASAADEVGRYQAIPLPKSNNDISQTVVIIDTKEGYLWEWVSTPPVGRIPDGYYLRYQGRVRPGKAIGEVVDQKQFTTPLK